MQRNFMQQVAAQGIEFIADAIAITGLKGQLAQRIVVQPQHGFSLGACAMIFAMREILRDG